MFENIRGADRACFTSSINTLVSCNSVDICILFEPRISGDKAISIARKLGFTNYHLEEAKGFSGGIWICWKDNVTKLEVVLSTKQSVTAIITINDKSLVFTAVYGSPQSSKKKHLWKLIDDIHSIAEKLNLPWTIVGDFNEIVCITEKKGGGNPFSNFGFGQCIDRNSLFDRRFIGQSFTWVSILSKVNPIRVRLDRGRNTAWKSSFPESYICHLLRIDYDHNPLLLSLFSNHCSSPQCDPFRFYCMWIDHEDFGNLIHSAWHHQTEGFNDKMSYLADQMQKWNRDLFANIFKQN